MLRAFINQEKRSSFLFIVVMAIGYISSVIIIGGPVTYSAPIGAAIGFILLKLGSYGRFKKEWKNRRQGYAMDNSNRSRVKGGSK